MPSLSGPLVPLLLVGAVTFGMPRRWLARRWGQALLVAGLALLVARYLSWRFNATVWPIEGWSIQASYIWALFLIECLAWFDTAILFMTLLRRQDRSREADRGEARLRAMNPGDLPIVDVMIATYNEPLEVLERTITGALALNGRGIA